MTGDTCDRWHYRVWDTTTRVMAEDLGIEELPHLRPAMILMQCTGLCDVHGVPIHEDDLVDCPRWSTARRVRWRNGGFHALAGRASHAGRQTALVAQEIYNNRIVVIGDAHRNPELTKPRCLDLLFEAAHP